jgi:hypothetical protein
VLPIRFCGAPTDNLLGALTDQQIPAQHMNVECWVLWQRFKAVVRLLLGTCRKQSVFYKCC